MRVPMLTTLDNPFSPHKQFDLWRAFDDQKGYHSCEYLARIAIVDELMSEEAELIEIERAIDEIVAMNPFGLHVKKVFYE